MKVSINWLKELVGLKVSIDEVVRLLPLRTIGLKEITHDFTGDSRQASLIELDMKGYNRADLLSMRGVAREVAAITDSKLKFEDEQIPKFVLPETPVKVENPELAPVYCIAKIENLKVEASNKIWVRKLNDSGMRAINNVADITNLIMLEYGQPMHAFDAACVDGETLVVRTARQGETLVTLDGKTRKLDTGDLLIADPKKALGLAGVMGGKHSEVSDTTTTILIEAAIFDPTSIRRTAQRHGLYSEASKRFQHGLTKTNLLRALAAAIKMYGALGGKLTALTLTEDLKDKSKILTLTQQKLNSLIGIDITPDFVETSLQSLGFHPRGVGSNWEVTVPYWRQDCNIEEDLIEEVARMYGYEKIPPKSLEGKVPQKLDQSLQHPIYDLKVALKNAGLTEVQTYSFYGSKTINDLQIKVNDLVKVSNPISSETEYMRDQIWPNLLEVVAKNIKQGFKDIAIFEIGKVYNPEKYHLAIALMNGSDNPMSELTSISRGVKLTHSNGVQMDDRNLFHPTRVTENMAEVHPRILNKFGIEKRVAILEIEI